MLLAQPGAIGSLTLKNRVIMAPMGTNYSTTDGLSTERDKMYYAERAKGGVAAIMTEAMVVTEQARPHHNSLCVYHDRFIPGLASIVAAIHRHECHVFGQLNHRGALLRRSVLNMEPVGPSPWRNPNTGDAVRPLTVPEMLEIQQLFVAAARRLVQAGYDGVEIHAGNGYLFQQFLTPRINRRSDDYGGSLANRMRFLLETVDRVRAALPKTVLIVRLSCTEYVPDGYGEDDIVALAQALQRAGVDALDLSGGSNESPQLSKYCIQPPSFPRGMLAPYARPIKQAVSIPCFVAGRIVAPEDAEAVLAQDCADYISLGRALYADAHWCRKAFGELTTPIRKCIACNICFERLTLEKDVSCVHNPMIGTEFERLEDAEPQLFPARKVDEHQRRRVLVLGAGVTGVEAARVLAGRGHAVEVWEKSDRVGGQMPLAVAAPDKREVEPVWSYRWEQVQALGVKVRTGIDATMDAIKRYAPDFAVVATGASPRPAPFDVSRLDTTIQLLHAWDVLADPDRIRAGAQVTIVGGGMVGMETADLLVARSCRVTVIEALADLAQGMARNNRMELVERVIAGGANMITQAAIVALEGGSLIIRAGEDTKAHAIGDVLLIAIGPRPVRDVVEILDAAGVDYALAGDCYRPGDFLTCIRDAWMIALSVDHRFARPR